MKFRHVWPDLSYKEKAIDFVTEFKKNNSRIHGGGRIARYLENSTYEEWLEYIENQKNVSVDESHVPENYVLHPKHHKKAYSLLKSFQHQQECMFQYTDLPHSKAYTHQAEYVFQQMQNSENLIKFQQ